jgi:MFS family permease
MTPVIEFFRNYRQRISLLSPGARKYLAGAACLGLAQGSFWALANLYFKHIGLEMDVIGRVISLRMLPTVLIAIPLAKLLTRMKMKTVLMSGAVLAGASYAGLISSSDALMIQIFSLILGFSNAIIQLAGPIFLMRNSSTAERVHLFGMGFAVRMGAGALGALTGGWLMKFLGERMGDFVTADRWVLLGFAFAALAALIPFFLIREEGKADEKEERKKLWPVDDPGTTFKLCIPEIFIGLGAGAFIPWINLYFKQVFGQQEHQIGTYFAMLQCINFFGFLLAPVIARKLGLLRIIVFTQFLSFPFLVIMGYSRFAFAALGYTVPFALIVGAFVCRGALMNMSHPISSNFALELVPRFDQPLTNSFRRLAWGLGFVLSSFLGGMVITWAGETFGLKNAFNFNIAWCILMYICAAASNYIFFRKTPRKIGICQAVTDRWISREKN